MEKDTVLLQQKIIHFKSELAKYKEKVKDYQENYHYALLEKLKKENADLIEEQEELKRDRNVSIQEANKRMQGLEQQLSNVKRLQEKQVQETELWKEKANRFQEDYKETSQRVVDLQKEASSLQYRLKKQEDELEKRKEEFHQQKQHFEKAEDDYCSRIEEYEAISQNLKKRLEETDGVIIEVKAKNEEQENHLKHLTEEIYVLEDKNETLSVDSQSYYHQVKRLGNLLSEAEVELKEQKSFLREAQEDWKEKELTFQQKAKTWDEEKRTYEKNKNEWTEKLSQRDKKLNELKQAYDQLKNQKEEWKDAKRNHQEQAKDWAKERQKYENQQKDLNVKLDEKAGLINDLKQANEQLKKQNDKILGVFPEEGSGEESGSGDILSLLDQEIKKLLGQTFEYEEELDSKIVFMTALENKVEQLGEEILALEVEESKNAHSKE
ncbi:hypothetical protein [Halobacillus sp. H74]|uniref:hypothetical protein n=1 Tax=Halobacillus sp. H74 TaxID=3457436 RepID=UPI003FCDEC4D